MENVLKKVVKYLKENDFPMNRVVEIHCCYEKLLDDKVFPKILIKFSMGEDSTFTIENRRKEK